MAADLATKIALLILLGALVAMEVYLLGERAIRGDLLHAVADGAGWNILPVRLVLLALVTIAAWWLSWGWLLIPVGGVFLCCVRHLYKLREV